MSVSTLWGNFSVSESETDIALVAGSVNDGIALRRMVLIHGITKEGMKAVGNTTIWSRFVTAYGRRRLYSASTVPLLVMSVTVEMCCEHECSYYRQHSPKSSFDKPNCYWSFELTHTDYPSPID